jgi:hypothetical protein
MTRDDGGQATIEAALTLPIVLIALLLIVQVGVVVRDALALQNAAREGARAGAITAHDDAIRDAVRAGAGPLEADAIEITVDPASPERRRGQMLDIGLRYDVRLEIPIVSRILTATLPLRATASMRMERAPEPSP